MTEFIVDETTYRQKIRVFITTYQVPFDQVVESITEFDTEQAAVEFINAQSAAWWVSHNGDNSIAAGFGEAYEPIKELAYETPQYILWGGEVEFHAMLDRATYDRMHDAHYKREFMIKAFPGQVIFKLRTFKPASRTTLLTDCFSPALIRQGSVKQLCFKQE